MIIVLAAEQAQAVTDVFHMPDGQTSLDMVTVGNVGNAADTTGYRSAGLGMAKTEGDISPKYSAGMPLLE